MWRSVLATVGLGMMMMVGWDEIEVEVEGAVVVDEGRQGGDDNELSSQMLMLLQAV